MHDAETEVQLPHEFRLAWGLDRGQRPGPRPSLTLEQILDSAIAIADADGLAALSMARVAKAVGFTTMSLYRYVTSKDELLQLISDAALPEPVIPPTLGQDWRGELEAWARAVLDAFLAHPWIVHVPLAGPPTLPRNIAWMDYCLRILQPLPLTLDERLSTLMLLSGHARNETLLTQQLALGLARSGRTEEEASTVYLVAMHHIASPDRFPGLHHLLLQGGLGPLPGEEPGRETAGEPPGPPPSTYDYGLGRILDGLGALVARREAQGGT